MRFFLLLWALLPLSLEWQFKTFSTQLTSAICFLLVPGRCLTSQKIKIETMKANDFNFLLSYLQVYLNLPFSFPSPAGTKEKASLLQVTFPLDWLCKATIVWKQQPGPTQLTSFLAHSRGFLYSTPLFLSPCSIQTAARGNMQHITGVMLLSWAKPFFMAWTMSNPHSIHMLKP